MERMDDRELNQLLREWKAPDAPPHLELPKSGRWLGRRSFSGGVWKWLLTGSIRVPVPVGVAAALLLGFWLYSSFSGREPVAVTDPPSRQPVVSLADFEPVEEVEVALWEKVK